MHPRLLPAAVLLVSACSDLAGLSSGAEVAQPEPDGGSDASAGGADVATSSSATLVIAKQGTGNGIVTSQDQKLDCGATCSHTYPVGALVALTGTPSPGSVFNGWSAPCGGTGPCFVPVAGDITIVAIFSAMVLDVDGNGLYEPTFDGILCSRYLTGFTGSALTDGAIGTGATRSAPPTLLAYLDSIRPQLDIDADGTHDALTDGILIYRYMLGLRGTSLTQGAVAPSGMRATAAQIESYMKTLMP